MGNFNSIMEEQFQLSYFGKIDYVASDNMSVFERNTMYGILLEQKKKERKAQEDAVRARKSKSSYKKH